MGSLYLYLYLSAYDVDLKVTNNLHVIKHKNSSGDEIANVSFYAVRPEATRIR